MEIDKIQEHMEVVGSDGKHVGTVDSMDEGNRLKLTRHDPAANNLHHWISAGEVDFVDDRVHLRTKASEAIANWTSR